ncbi:MAG: PAS domain S-box protein [Nitrospiraceae bacterium]|nr:PAS domain S-box protein [Nitrospiraceae bacterium]
MKKDFFKLPGWLLITIAAVIAVLTVAGIFVLHLKVEDAVRAELFLARLKEQANLLNSFEFKMLGKRRFDPDEQPGIKDPRENMDKLFIELAAIDGSSGIPQGIQKIYKDYIAALEEEFMAIRKGKPRLAESIDEKKVDPIFRSLTDGFNRAEYYYSSYSVKTHFIVETSSLLLLIIGGLLIGGTMYKYQQARQKVELIKTEREILQSSEERFRSLIENSSDGIFLINRDGSVNYASPSAYRMLGLAGKAAINRLAEAIQPAERERFDGFLARCIDEGLAAGEFRFRHPEGRPVIAEVISKNRLHDPAVQAIVMNCRDISARKLAEAQQARLAAAISSTAEAILVAGAGGRIEYVNPAFEQITGYTMEEALGKPLHFTRDGTGAEGDFSGHVREVLAHGQTWSGCSINKRKDGSIYHAEDTISPVRGPDGEITSLVAVERDISERLRIESVAEALNTTNNIGYIFSGIRHELGNPVNSLKVTLTVLDARLGQCSIDEVRTYLGRSLSELARIEYLLRTLKNFNMYEKLSVTDLNMGEFFEGLIELVREDFKNKGVKITVAVAGGCTANADARALQQVLLNVLGNAADAIGGEKTAGQIGIDVTNAAGMVSIEVADNGKGMTWKEQQGLFKPFFTTKPNGTGLGLVITKKMVSKMGGTISVNSRPSEGTTVRISLPEGRQQPA